MKKILFLITLTLLTFSSCSTLVHINSEPQGAYVIIDGKTVGETPLDVTIPDRSWEKYNVIVMKKGYEPIDRELDKEIKVGPVVASIPFCCLPWPLIWAQGPKSDQYFILKKTGNPKDSDSDSEGGTTVFLKDGGKFIGEIINQDESKVVIKTKYTTVTIEKEKIKEIKHK